MDELPEYICANFLLGMMLDKAMDEILVLK